MNDLKDIFQPMLLSAPRPYNSHDVPSGETLAPANPHPYVETQKQFADLCDLGELDWNVGISEEIDAKSDAKSDAAKSNKSDPLHRRRRPKTSYVKLVYDSYDAPDSLDARTR